MGLTLNLKCACGAEFSASAGNTLTERLVLTRESEAWRKQHSSHATATRVQARRTW